MKIQGPIKLKAPAKINLGLKVKGLRTDGYHEIETVLQMVSLFDEITFEERKHGIELITEEGHVPSGEENIIYKSAKLFFREVGGSGVRIRLRKGIPVAAGLGGGSSDAAATLTGLNRLSGSSLEKEELIELGRRVGSDVPFFLFGPSAIAMGRGDILSPISPLRAWVLLVNPNFPVSTAWAYQNYERLNHRSDTLLTKGENNIKLQPLLIGDNLDFLKGISNDLEGITIMYYPEIKEIKEALLCLGALCSLMSGSGPTIFGVFSQEELARKASLRFTGCRVFVTKTLTRLPFS